MNLVIANSVVILTFLVLLQLHGESNAEALATHHIKHNLLNKLHHHLHNHDKHKQDDDYELEKKNDDNKHKQDDHDKHKHHEHKHDHPKHLPPPPPPHPPVKNPCPDSKEHIPEQKLHPCGSGPHLPTSGHFPMPEPPLPLPNKPLSPHLSPSKHPLPYSHSQPGQGSVNQYSPDETEITGDGNSVNKLQDLDTNINIPITIVKD